MLPNGSVPDVREARRLWGRTIQQIHSQNLVSLDESGVDINMARRYGRSVGKKRVVDSAPSSTPKSTTVVSAIRLDGQSACTAYEGGTTKGRFIAYVRDTLLPSIRKGDYVVMVT